MDEYTKEGGAAKALEGGGEGGQTFFLPADFPGHESCKPGDSLTLKVVGKTPEGEIEVAHVAGEKESDWKGDLRSHMAAESTPEEM